jgi:hypothetical protein
MAFRNNHIAKLDANAVRERLAGLRASYRGELDAQAVREKEERRRLVKASFTLSVCESIAVQIPKVARKVEVPKEVTDKITADIIEAAAAMVDDVPGYAIETRHRREQTRTSMYDIENDSISHARDLCRLSDHTSEHFEARLFLRSPALLDLLAKAAECLEDRPTNKIGAYILRHYHEYLNPDPDDERRGIASCGDNLVPWHLGLVKLMLEIHSISRRVVGDLGPVRQGERGAPYNPAERNAISKVAASCDKHLGTWLLTDKPNKPYRAFLRLCEVSFSHVVANWRSDYNFESPVKTVLGYLKPSEYERKIPRS